MQPENTQPETADSGVNNSAGFNPPTQNVQPQAGVQPAYTDSQQPTSAPAMPGGVIQPQASAPQAAQPQQPAPFTPAQPTQVTEPFAPVAAQPPKKGGFFSMFKSKKVLLLAFALPLLLIGSGAAAYYGVVVPNQPENVLKAAIANTIQQKQINFDGTVDVSAADPKKSSDVTATSVSFKGGSDADKQAFQTQMDVTMTGVKLSGDVRYLDQTMYVKLGDLSTVKALLSAYGPGLAPLIDKVQNQWVEIDKTLLKQAGAECYVNQKVTFTKADIQTLSDAYDKYKFVTIKSTASEKVGTVDAVKYELAIDDNKAADSVVDLSKLSPVSSFKGCDSSNKTSVADVQKELRDNDSTPVTVWIDKSTKRIVKIASNSTQQDADKDNLKGSASVVLTYGSVTVEKPSGAKPLMTLIGELQSSSNGLLGGSSGSSLLSQKLFE